MDEATASIDKRLDKLIQDILMNELGGYTILTIAHRLETVLGYDKIVVMRDGEKIEEGTPKELFDLGGEFHRMMTDSGLEI